MHGREEQVSQKIRSLQDCVLVNRSIWKKGFMLATRSSICKTCILLYSVFIFVSHQYIGFSKGKTEAEGTSVKLRYKSLLSDIELRDHRDQILMFQTETKIL